ncbi:hypothetical protein G6F62_014936 [Rhizopus arrhizus]|nr:hypothetical protein G6F62_014936 [Rhizopus arrhizus]
MKSSWTTPARAASSARTRNTATTARRRNATTRPPHDSPTFAFRAQHDAHVGRRAWLPRRQLRPVSRRSAVRGRRVRLGQKHLVVGRVVPDPAGCRQRLVRHA